MGREEYIEQKRGRVSELASGMLDGSVDYLEGAIKLATLRLEVEVADDDEDFMVFVAVASDIDHLPIGAARLHWSDEALARHEAEIRESIEWAKSISLPQCKSLSERFSA